MASDRGQEDLKTGTWQGRTMVLKSPAGMPINPNRKADAQGASDGETMISGTEG
jgi:hypothetical protein